MKNSRRLYQPQERERVYFSRSAGIPLEAAVYMWRNGMTQLEIADEFYVTEKTIWRLFKKNNIKKREICRANC